MKRSPPDDDRQDEVIKRFTAVEEDLCGVGDIDFVDIEFIECPHTYVTVQDRNGRYVFLTKLELICLTYEDTCIEDMVRSLRETADAIEAHLAESADADVEVEAVAGGAP